MESTVEQDFVSKIKEEPVPLPVLIIVFIFGVFGVAGFISLKKKGTFK